MNFINGNIHECSKHFQEKFVTVIVSMTADNTANYALFPLMNFFVLTLFLAIKP